MTFFATVSAVLHAGGKPVFADIDDNYCIDPESVRRQITSRTKGIIPVHLYGYAVNMDELCSIASEKSLFILEDCAQAIGTKYHNKSVGSIGQAGAFSFFATKNMTTGEGGLITTDDEKLAATARMMRSHGMMGRDDHLLLGYNFRMTEMEAAIGLIQLRKLEKFNHKRRENSMYLYDRIRDLDWIGIQKFEPHIKHTFFWCPIFIREDIIGIKTAEVRKKLRNAGIETRQRYQEPLYRQPILREESPYERQYDISCPFNGKTVRYEDLFFPNAEKYSGRLLGLPNHPGMTQAQLDWVVESIHAISADK